MRLLFLNSFRSILRKKVQLIGIIVLIMLSIAIYVGINSAIDRLENSYYDYLNKQNVEDISVYVNIDYSTDISVQVLDDLRKNELSDVTYDEDIILDEYRNYLLDENRNYDLVLTNNVKNIFEYYEANQIIEANILDSLMDKYYFSYELEKSKTIISDDIITKVIPYSIDGLNKTYLVDGREPQSDDEINLLPGFAMIHNIRIGDKFRICDNDYTVVGFSYASDYIYPLISVSKPIFEQGSNNIVFMTSDAFNKVIGINENVYSIKYSYDYHRLYELSIDEELTDSIFSDKHIFSDLNNVTRITRIGTIGLEFDTNRLFAKYLLYLVLAISFIIIFVIMKKQIDSDKLQIGILKSIGYGNISIAFSYLLYPILTFTVGMLFGCIIGGIIQNYVSNMLLSFYCVPLNDFVFSFNYLYFTVIALLVLCILTYIFIIFKLRKQNISLLKDGSNLKVNFFSKFLNKLFFILPFEFRFKYSLAFRSLGRLFLISLISFCTGLLIVLVLICSNLFSNVVDKSFDGVNYNYIVTLDSVETEEIGDSLKSDYILSVNMDLVKIIDSNNNEKEVNSDIDFTFTGIDHDSKFIDVLSGSQVIDDKLVDNNIIVNINIKERYDLDIGDKLEFMYGDISFIYNIVDFNDEYTGYNIYIDREYFSNELGFDLPIYNSIYSNDIIYNDLSRMSIDDVSKIIDIVSINDLKLNMKEQMNGINSIIYPIIFCSSLIVFIIIFIVASFIIDENKRTISLMKIIGYSDNKISSMVLNIYTPFIILSYFLSIPIMIKILNIIVKQLINNIDFIVPIEISWSMILLGLGCLLMAYNCSITLSRKRLDNVPLAEISKRE